jgi:TRAP-type C4-dicarboxylate transport system substrate-binding protein
VAGALPAIEVQSLWGIYPDWETMYYSLTDMHPLLEAMVADETDGGIVVNHNWYSGNDQFFFSNTPLRSLDDFDGLKTRSHAAALSDWINGMGAEAQFLAFAEVYTALERGILDAGVTGSTPGHGQRWYEVTNNLIGPAISLPMGFETMNKDTWSKIPADLQAIIIEEGAKMELENLRLAAVWNETGVKVNVDKGMTFIEWPDDMKEHIHQNVALGRVLPNWIKRVGPEEIALWNEIVAPWAKVEIGDDGSITAVE